MATAAMCVRDIYPDSKIETIRVDGGPLQLSISVVFFTISSSPENDNGVIMWTSKQQDLFEKYPKRRRRAMASIRRALTSLKHKIEPTASSMSAEKFHSRHGISDDDNKSSNSDDGDTNSSRRSRNDDHRRVNITSVAS